MHCVSAVEGLPSQSVRRLCGLLNKVIVYGQQLRIHQCTMASEARISSLLSYLSSYPVTN